MNLVYNLVLNGSGFGAWWIGILAQRDYYDVLGVSRSATADEIRRAYKKLARKYHPDANGGDPQTEQKFAEITEAHEVLSDVDKRKKYNQFGHNWSRVAERGPGGGNPFEGFTGRQPFGAGGHGSGRFAFDDILGGVFRGKGGPRRPPPPPRGRDVQTNIQVPFVVGVEGGEHELTVRTGDKLERLSFRIPPGIESGKTIRLAGQGHPGPPGTRPGNVLVTVEITDHPWFRRHGCNLVMDLPVTITEASLGAKVEVPTLSDGTMIVSIPPGTSSGARLRLRGKGGINRKTGIRGDQLMIVRITVPKNLSAEARQVFRDLDQLTDASPRDGLWT